MNPYRTYKMVLADSQSNEPEFKLNSSNQDLTVDPSKSFLDLFKSRSKHQASNIVNKLLKVGVQTRNNGILILPNNTELNNGVSIVKYLMYPQLLKKRKPNNVDKILNLINEDVKFENKPSNNSGWISIYKLGM